MGETMSEFFNFIYYIFCAILGVLIFTAIYGIYVEIKRFNDFFQRMVKRGR